MGLVSMLVSFLIYDTWVVVMLGYDQSQARNFDLINCQTRLVQADFVKPYLNYRAPMLPLNMASIVFNSVCLQTGYLPFVLLGRTGSGCEHNRNHGVGITRSSM